MTPILIDSDNAIEAPSGDVDDAFAIAALLRARVPVVGIGAVAGNTGAREAMEGNRAIARLCEFDGPLLRGKERGEEGPSEVARWLAVSTAAIRVAAIGPLSNVADALAIDPGLAERIEELVLVGGNRASLGRWPPLWPWEFNLAKDRAAASAVFASRARLTIVPLDVAKRMMVRGGELDALPGEIGRYLCARSQRWLRRARLLKLRDGFPLWDLVATMMLVDRGPFRVERTRVRFTSRGWLEFGRGAREADVVVSFDRDAVWTAFAELVAGDRRTRA
ncbi:MAG: nucleoside hydrolase [Thermoanaerobaculia bacterium]|nr:nucleoside hydrolase [Thermoanaerobaculia bacterium]